MQDVTIGDLTMRFIGDDQVLLEQHKAGSRNDDVVLLDAEQQLAIARFIYKVQRKTKAFAGEVHSRAELEMDSRHLADMVTRELPKGVGFAVFVFSFGAKGNLAYISNAERGDMIRAILEWVTITTVHRPSKVLAGHWTPDGIRPDPSDS